MAVNQVAPSPLGTKILLRLPLLLFFVTWHASADKVTLVDFGATWRYHDKGQDLATVPWRAANFDDSAWALGKAELVCTSSIDLLFVYGSIILVASPLLVYRDPS